MTISSLECRHGAEFSGVFRVRQPHTRTARNGSQYLSMFIEDATGSIKAYAWSENLDISFKEFDRVELSGAIRSFNNTWIANILSAKKVEVTVDNSLQLIPKSICPFPTLLEQLDELVSLISLKFFLCFKQS